MSKIDPTKTLTENLTAAAQAFLKVHGVDQQIRTTITHGRIIGGAHWWVGSDQIIEGYGKNHRPEESLWKFEEIDGSYFVVDSMSMENMLDLLEEADAA